MNVIVLENTKGSPLLCVKPKVEVLERLWLSRAAEQAEAASHLYNN
jgi:hypothetical protein